MKILFTQETDWINRNPIQPHHLAELLSLRGHEIRVIDYELIWMSDVSIWKRNGVIINDRCLKIPVRYIRKLK